LSTPTAPV
ncbi:unnamed protein product, partial [Rotaria sordida]